MRPRAAVVVAIVATALIILGVLLLAPLPVAILAAILAGIGWAVWLLGPPSW